MWSLLACAWSLSGPGAARMALGPEPEGLAAGLHHVVRRLAAGPRTGAGQVTAAGIAEEALARAGWTPAREYVTPWTWNVVAERPGTDRPHEIVILGASYDSWPASPGADSNASGVAMVIEVARALPPTARTVRVVLFTDLVEEWGTMRQGSEWHAAAARAHGDGVAAMIAVHGVGYFDEAAGTQRYPYGMRLGYPSSATPLFFVGDPSSADTLHEAHGAFTAAVFFPTIAAILPRFVAQTQLADDAPFRDRGYPAILVTGAPPFRNPHYAGQTDTPDTLDYGRMARIVPGLVATVEALATP